MKRETKDADELDEVVRRIEQTLTDHLDGTDELERLLFSVELIANTPHSGTARRRR